jgi:hypothetical protein
VTRGQLGTTAVAHSTGVAVNNELSRCTTAPWAASLGTSTNSTAFTDVGGGFNATVVGNMLWLASGAGATVGAYTVVAYISATQITLDRVSGTYTAGVWKIGGAWAGPEVNLTAAVGVVKPGHQIYYRAGGSGSVGSPDFTFTNFLNTPPQGTTAAGKIRIIGENGRAFIKAQTSHTLMYYVVPGWYFQGLYFVVAGTTYQNFGCVYSYSDVPADIVDCIFDQNGIDATLAQINGDVVDSEFFSSTANGGAAGTYAAVVAFDHGSKLRNCNIHNCWGDGVLAGFLMTINGSIIAKNTGNGIVTLEQSNHYGADFSNNTIDGNGGHGILVSGPLALTCLSIKGNFITNHTGSGKYGISVASGTAALNDSIRGFIDHNWYYNNTSNANALTVGTSIIGGVIQLHDSIGVDPGYTAQSTQNYAIGTAAKALGFPQNAFKQSTSGQTTGVRSYVDVGAVQRQEPSGSSVIVVNQIRNIHIHGAR